MVYLLVGAVGAVLCLVWLMRADGKREARGGAVVPAPLPARIDVPGAAPVAAPLPPPPLPEALQAHRTIRLDELTPTQRQDMFTLFRKVPRPPSLMQQLLSPDFLATASSAQLVDLIAAEPLLAARLLAVVNSPLHGLARPATSIDQAVMVLGVNSVRAMCLQYLMLAAFRSDDRARAERLEASWRASAIASELAQMLCQQMHLPDAGATVSALVLSFLGRLAVEGTATTAQLLEIPQGDLLERSAAEQAVLGLSAAEIGRLVLGEWGLPEAIVADAADIDGVLTQPADRSWPEREGRLALAYFCARIGERLALRQPVMLEGLVLADDDADFHHFRSYLEHPWLRQLDAALKALGPKLERLRA